MVISQQGEQTQKKMTKREAIRKYLPLLLAKKITRKEYELKIDYITYIPPYWVKD